VRVELTRAALRERCPLPSSIAGFQYPREESNLALDLRAVACLRHTPRMSSTKFRGLGSNQRQRVQSPPSYH
jgi:hypothetical protein